MRLRRAFLVLLSVLVAVALVEWAGRFAMSRVFHRGRVFRYHPELGWTAIPGARVVRRNPAGGEWTVRVNGEGFRGPAAWPASAAKRILILGDSFTFGEGVEDQERLDAVMSARKPGWAIVNLGMAGYGTDQELLAGRPRFHLLKRGDAVVLQTYANDFQDILRRSSSLRAKPWFELREGRLVSNPPRVGVFEKLRDRSYLLAALGTAYESLRRRPLLSDDERRSARDLYQALVLSMWNELRPKGVGLVIASHGGADVPEGLCALQGVRCVALDRLLDGGCFFADGPRHWKAKGHHRVAEELLRVMDDKPGEMR